MNLKRRRELKPLSSEHQQALLVAFQLRQGLSGHSESAGAPKDLAEFTPTVDELALARQAGRTASACLAFLDSLSEADFGKTAADAPMKLASPAGKQLRANDFLITRQIPNFFFHVSIAYALLRQAGVNIGKGDYLEPLPYIES